MKIARNSTDVCSNRLREILLFVAPPGVGGYEVELTNCRWHFRGRAWPCSNRVLLRVGPHSRFPFIGHRRLGKKGPRKPGKGYLPTPPIMSREEALVMIAAHELRHLWQRRVPRGRRVWGARGQYSERDADAYAIRMLRAWRRQASEGV